jgi:hypothetical protein
MENSREMGRVQLYTRPDQPGQLQSWQVQKCGGFLAWFKGGTPPGFWTTTASVLLQVIEMKGDVKDTPLDQGVDHVDHPWHKQEFETHYDDEGKYLRGRSVFEDGTVVDN